MGDDSAERMMRLLDEALLAGREDSVYDLLQGVTLRAKQEGVPVDGGALLEYWWDLARMGVVAILGDSYPTVVLGQRIPRLRLTSRGRRLLELGERSPHNPSKYLSALRARVAQPDDITLTYLHESVEAWRNGLNRSSAVMLGCACERLILLLAESISAGAFPPWSGKLHQKLQVRVFISEVFELVRKALTGLRNGKRLSDELGDALDRRMSAIFDHARGLRNQSGHPTGTDVSAENAEAGLLLFPGFYELVDKLIGQIRGRR